MLASSAFVLAALTMTGVYMKGQNVESKDDGYTLDFTALENNADDKLQEITENNEEHLLKEDENIPGLTANNTAGNEIAGAPVTEDDLDYMPQEVGSGHVEIPGLTDQETLLEAAQKEPVENRQQARMWSWKRHCILRKAMGYSNRYRVIS